MKTRCECGGRGELIATGDTWFSLTGVNATYKIKCEKCGKEWIGEFHFPYFSMDDHYVGEHKEKKEVKVE